MSELQQEHKMNSDIMTARTERKAEVSPRTKARLAGVFELLEGFTSAGGQVVILGGLYVAGNAATTAANILKINLEETHESHCTYKIRPSRCA
jgi:hypothetical protein